jgi:hypothetical protein
MYACMYVCMYAHSGGSESVQGVYVYVFMYVAYVHSGGSEPAQGVYVCVYVCM